jgi:HSP20 family protein
MADTQRESRTNETAQRTQEPRGRSDVARTPETQHEVQRQGTSGGGELSRRGIFDVGGDPFAMMHALRREMDRLFDNFGFGGSLLHGSPLFGDLDRSFGDMARNIWSPRVEVYERDGKLHVSADLPGLKKDDVRVEVLDNQLTIEGERRSEQRDEKGAWSERSYGRFFRSIPLPEGINPDSASASFENGVLHIALDAPKREERRGKQIPIGEAKSGK